jgi:hypothetical protein
MFSNKRKKQHIPNKKYGLARRIKLVCKNQISTITTLALGSKPRQGVVRLRAKRKTRESHHMRKCQREWGNEPSHSQVNSHVGSWSPKSSECNSRSQNPWPRGVFYIIGKLLKLKCLKWAHIAHLDIWNTSYGQKKGRESNWQFDSRPLKIRNWPDLLVCRQHATYPWKALDDGYNFAWDLIAIGGLHTKLCASKVAGVPTMGIWESQDKKPFGCDPMESYRIYYNGEGGGFPQVRAMVSLVCLSCMWLVLAPKVFQLCTNHPMLVLYRFVWITKAFQFFLFPSRSSSTPFYPSKVMWTREHASTPYSSVVFSLGFTFESCKELGADHQH